MKPHTEPPRLLDKLINRLIAPHLREEVLGDLHERYALRVRRLGVNKARQRYWRDALTYLRLSNIKRKPAEYPTIHSYSPTMLRNYFKIGFRNLIKYKAFSLINIFGLAVAMSVCMLMILMYADQLSYDQFHKNKERVYRINSSPMSNSNLRATIPFPVADKLKAYPFIEEIALLRRGFGGDAVHNLNYSEMRGFFTTSSFFKVFSYDLEAGNAATALEKPNSLVITHKMAKKLFGKQDPIGKTIQFSQRGLDTWSEESHSPVDWGLFTVTGVFADHEYKSHLSFDAIVSASTLEHLYKEKKIEDLVDDWTTDHQAYTYILLSKTADENKLNDALAQVSKNFKLSKYPAIQKSKLVFQSLTKINPGPVVNNSPTNSLPLFVYYILGGLVLVIMFAACLNYTSLSIARSITRSGEIGLRKVIGAQSKDLVLQFLSETSITVLFSLVLANFFLLFLKTAFLNLWINKYLNFDLKYNLYVYLAFVGFSLIISFISGIFPALRLSKASPMAAMKKWSLGSAKKWSFRSVLTVSQFTISLIFIITSIVIYDQFKHYRQFDYGFNPKNIININLQSNDFQLVKNRLKDVKGVKELSGCAYLPATGRNDNLELKIPGKEKTFNAISLTTDDNFIKTLDIKLLYGKNIKSTTTGKSDLILVNEEATRNFGFKNPSEILGQTYELNGQSVQVAGVFKDITFYLLFAGRPTGPIVLHTNPEELKYITVKIEGGATNAVLKELTDSWKTIDPIHPIQYEFYEDTLSNTNQGIYDLASVVSLLAFLAITIACLGLLGMAIYTTERRTKEIGVRKVLGASEWSLNYQLAKEFLIMIAIAVLIAAPSAYFANNLWLNFMVVRADLTIGTLVLGSLILLILGLLTIVPQTYKIAKRNPVESLKTE